MTKDELNQTKPRGEIDLEHEGRAFKAFVCYGCQTCWSLNEKDEIEEYYPHFLSIKETTNATHPRLPPLS